MFEFVEVGLLLLPVKVVAALADELVAEEELLVLIAFEELIVESCPLIAVPLV